VVEAVVVGVAVVLLQAMVVTATLQQPHHLLHPTLSLSMGATRPLHLKVILRAQLRTALLPPTVPPHHKRMEGDTEVVAATTGIVAAVRAGSVERLLT